MKIFKLPLDIEEKTETKYRHEKSYNGYSPSDLKSWLQKSIRRGNSEEAIWAAVELYTLPKQSVVTNLFNRIRIISMEDIGVANPGMINLVDCVLEKLQTKGKPTLPVTEDGVVAIAELVSSMAKSKHLRLCSDYKSVFITPRDREKLMKLFPDIYEPHKKVLNALKKYPKNIGANDIRELGKKLVKMLEEKDDCAFYVMAKILDVETLPFKTMRSANPAYYILDCISKVDGMVENTVDILAKWLKGGIINSKVDHSLPLYFAMLLALKRDEVDGVPNFSIKIKISNFEAKRKLLKIPDYALDKHTLAGRMAGKTAEDFANEGAFVENEDSKLYNARYRELYLRSKGNLDVKVVAIKPVKVLKVVVKSVVPRPAKVLKVPRPAKVPLESDIFEFDVRVQATVTDQRTDTYFATEKLTGRKVFVKGPYKNEEEVDIPVKICNIKKLIAEELPFVNLEKVLAKPDLFPDVPWGFRRHTIRENPYWFLVSDCLAKPFPVPRKIHNTKKWGDVEVVDFSKVKEPRPLSPFTLKGKSLQLYVLNNIFRYSIGVLDPADRNFILLATGDVYSVDEESFGREVKLLGFMKQKKCTFIINYIKSEWKSLSKIFKLWLVRFEKHKKTIEEMTSLANAKWILEKLKRIQKMEDVCKLFD